MLQKISDFFWRISGWKNFLVGLALWLVFGTVIMPWGAATMRQINGKKTEVLDLQFSYTPEQARAIIADYSVAGRDFAANFELIADTLYPVAYTFLFLMIISWVFKSLSVYGFRIRYVHLLPFLVMLADYCENTGIIRMLKSYPDFSDTVATVTSLFTSLKWSLLAVQAFIIGAAIWLLTFYRMTRGKVASR
jgi:hypothetical protein